MFEILFHLLTTITSPQTIGLAEAMHNLSPREVSEETASLHAIAASIAATEDVPASLLLSMAYLESRYNEYSVSHVRAGKRRGGVFKSKEVPAGVSGPYFCGVTQVTAGNSWKRCTEYRDIHLAYRTAAETLTRWLNDPYCRKAEDKLYCALLGYGGGYPAIKTKSLTYPNRVLGRARALDRAAAGNT